jgi:tripartite-type tricarboxylate transporter receptor subunit TctC
MVRAADELTASSRQVPIALGNGDTWPTRPIRLIVPQAPGGTADATARMVGDRLEPVLGVPVVVDDRPGANGMIAGLAVRRSPADGTTLLLASTHTFVIAPMVSAGESFDPVRDFVPVANLATQTKVLLVSLATPATTARELVDHARRRPGALNYASTGIGSASHLDTELFARANGLELVQVPYRGSSQTMTALVTNEVQVLLASVSSALGSIQAGQVRALAILDDRRSPLLREVPTLAESGLTPLDVRTWLGIAAPEGTPRAIVVALNDALGRILASAAMREWLAVQGMDGIAGSPETFGAQIRADAEKWGGLVQRLGIARR